MFAVHAYTGQRVIRKDVMINELFSVLFLRSTNNIAERTKNDLFFKRDQNVIHPDRIQLGGTYRQKLDRCFSDLCS